jgi:hypothetical protein
MGSIVVNTDRSITELKKNWIKSLYSEFEIEKPLTKEQDFQMMILLGEFLAEEIYQLGDNDLISKELRERYMKISNSLGHYMDKSMMYVIYCYENGEKVELPEGVAPYIEDACARAIEFLPEPKKVMDKFFKTYGVKFTFMEGK